MAVDPRKRQKKLAKEHAKRKEKAIVKRREKQGKPSFFHNMAYSLELELASRGPILECYVNANLLTSDWGQGMGTVIVSRRGAGGMIAVGVYLLDVFCLGVKDAFARLVTREEFNHLINQTSLHEPLKKVAPSEAKKLIEDTVAYARGIGFEPHPDFRPSRKLLEGIDTSECLMEFKFGDQGKPHFISGPYDSEARIRQIHKTLEQVCGEGNYNITILLGDPFPDDESDDEYHID